MKFCTKVITLNVTSTPNVVSHSFNHSKMSDVQISEAGVVRSPFSLAQQRVTVSKHS
jgi:hypothetical protein